MAKDNIEYEAKVLNIDSADVIEKLEALGATKVKDYTFRRYVFDTLPKIESRWVRLRSDGEKTTLTVKQIASDEIDGTSEWEVVVSDIDTTLTILEKIGLTPRGYQENLRTEYDLEGVEISIDTWPRLQPYIEIEATNKATVIETARRLGFDESQLTGANTEKLYSEIGIDLSATARLTFEE